MSRFFAAVLLGTMIIFAGISPARAATNVLFIFDASGSMWGKVDNQAKIVVARKAMKEVLKDLPADTKLGLMSYGHRRKGDCQDIEVVMPVGSSGASAIAKKIDILQPKGSTPIANALKQSAGAFSGMEGKKMIVLVTDGAEECEGDPCAAAKELAAQDIDLHINVVGFNLGEKQRKAVECIADEGHGKYYDAADGKSLTAALTEVKTQVVEAAPPAPPAAPPPPAELNLLSLAEGGQLIAAPGDGWAGATSGKDNDVAGICSFPAEVIYGFKNGGPATFSKFEILIPHADGGIIKDFEVLAADESPAGDFRSLGQFTTQNMKMMKTPYQAFTFPETTAKYLKVRLTSSYGVTGAAGCSMLTQIRLIGKPAEGTAAAPAEQPSGVNLLAPKEGGQLVAAPADGWAKAMTGKDDDVVNLCSFPSEAIFSFKDDSPATFSRFKMLIPHADGGIIKDFEILAADDSPTGSFRSLGQFTTLNMRMVKSPYQEFSFPETTAKYLKVKLISSNGVTGAAGCSKLNQIQLIGKLAEASASAAAPATPKPAAGTNLLAAAAGGQLLASPTDEWTKAITGKDDEVANVCGFPSEGIFGFKDEKPATFSRFEILIPHADGGIIKEFEILAGDESPTGAYRSLGQFTTQDVRMVKSPYQAFDIPETTAKYLKVKLISSYGVTGAAGCSKLTQIKLIGKQ